MIENLIDKTIFLAKDKNTNTFINQNYKDRLFHTFVIGETGCGKLSQMIVPMVKQDLDNSAKNRCSVIFLDPTSNVEPQIYNYANNENIPILRFNPIYTDCPYYNPLALDEETCVKNFSNMFLTLHPEIKEEYKESTLTLIKNSIYVVKKLYKNKSILKNLEDLLSINNKTSKKIIDEFSRVYKTSEDIELASWFTNHYFKEIGKERDKYSSFCLDISRLNKDTYLGRILNPVTSINIISFEEIVLNDLSAIVNMNYCRLGDIGKILSALITSEIQSAVFKRNIDNNPSPLFLYFHELQEYYNVNFTDLVMVGRTCNVGCILSLQSLKSLDTCIGKEEKGKLVSNVRNLILYPYVSDEDIEFFKPLFEKLIETLDPHENIIKKSEFSESNLKYRNFPEFLCSLILNNKIQLPLICSPLEYK